MGGDRALRRPDLGRLEPSAAQANLVAFSLDDFRNGVTDDPLRTRLLNGTALQAVVSVAAGRTLMADGIDGVDLDFWRRKGQEIFDKVRSVYSLGGRFPSASGRALSKRLPTVDQKRIFSPGRTQCVSSWVSWPLR